MQTRLKVPYLATITASAAVAAVVAGIVALAPTPEIGASGLPDAATNLSDAHNAPYASVSATDHGNQSVGPVTMRLDDYDVPDASWAKAASAQTTIALADGKSAVPAPPELPLHQTDTDNSSPQVTYVDITADDVNKGCSDLTPQLVSDRSASYLPFNADMGHAKHDVIVAAVSGGGIAHAVGCQFFDGAYRDVTTDATTAGSSTFWTRSHVGLADTDANDYVGVLKASRAGRYQIVHRVTTITNPMYLQAGEPVLLSLSPTDVSAREYAGDVDVEMRASRVPQSGLLLKYYLDDGSAKAGKDFVNPVMPKVFAFAPEYRTPVASVALIDDEDIESDETFTLRVGDRPDLLTGGTLSARWATHSSTTITVQDGGAETFSTLSWDGAHATPGSTMSVKFHLDRANKGPIAVDWTTADGTALAGTDYTASSGRLLFNAGDTEKTVEIPVLAGATAGRLFQVKASLHSGKGLLSYASRHYVVQSVPAASPVPPVAVSSVSVTRSDGKLTATWNAVQGATSYHVTYTGNGGTRLANLSHLSEGDVVSITIDGVSNSHSYTVGVRAKNAGGGSGWVNSSTVGPYSP